MKKLTKAIFIVALLNLLAVIAGAGWLFSSGRVDKARIQNMARLFNEPVEVEQGKIKAEEARVAKELAEQEKPLPALALNTQERNQVRVEMTQIDRQRLDRMKREVKDLQASLRRERKLVEEDRLGLEAEKEAFKVMRERLAGIEGGNQFQKSLASISGMKAKDAKAILSTLLVDDKAEEVITYLSSMEDRTRTSIITEFVKSGEEALAANLLESIRLRGLGPTPTDETNQ